MQSLSDLGEAAGDGRVRPKSLWLMEKVCRGPLTPRAHATYSAAKWDKVG